MVTRTLARNLVASRYDDIPQAVRHEAARALLNWLGCAIGSSRHETVECALAALAPFSGPPQAAVLGRRERLDILHAALIYGAAGEFQFSDAVVRDPEVGALRDRVSAQAAASIRRTEAHVTIALKDGRTYSKHVAHALGTLQRPMSDADLEAKFRGLTAGILAPGQIDEVITLCWQLTALEDAGALARAAAPRAY